mmetsp:Transcript_21151/g.58294  ORF Transcript_21151/g.58294 Transcript_21151/m.58294 type:complete len:275 (-) Transcript_21151:171-995(-)
MPRTGRGRREILRAAQVVVLHRRGRARRGEGRVPCGRGVPGVQGPRELHGVPRAARADRVRDLHHRRHLRLPSLLRRLRATEPGVGLPLLRGVQGDPGQGQEDAPPLHPRGPPLLQQRRDAARVLPDDGARPLRGRGMGALRRAATEPLRGLPRRHLRPDRLPPLRLRLPARAGQGAQAGAGRIPAAAGRRGVRHRRVRALRRPAQRRPSRGGAGQVRGIQGPRGQPAHDTRQILAGPEPGPSLPPQVLQPDLQEPGGRDRRAAQRAALRGEPL